MLSLPSHTAPEPANALRTALDKLNAVALSGTQIAAALEVLAALPDGHRDNPHAQAAVLQAYAGDAGFGPVELAAAALHARVTALAEWTAANDPGRQSDLEAVMEATARFPLSETDKGIGFEAAAFQEFILFIEELPF